MWVPNRILTGRGSFYNISYRNKINYFLIGESTRTDCEGIVTGTSY